MLRRILITLVLIAGVSELADAQRRIFRPRRPAAGVGQANGFDTACSRTAAGVDRASVQAAVDAAADGDTICVPSGTATWTSAVEGGSKAFELRGAGNRQTTCSGNDLFLGGCGAADQTVIHCDSTDHKCLSVTGSASNYTIITNIKWTADDTTDTMNFGVILVNAQDSGELPVIIRYNTFDVQNTCNGPKLIVYGAKGGIITRNRAVAEVIDTGGCNRTNTNVMFAVHLITDDGSWWGSAHTLGTADASGQSNLYVEANYIEGMNSASDMNTSSRMVRRFNDLHGASWSGHGYDSSTQGQRHWEDYGNHYHCDVEINLSNYNSHRGGTGMIFNEQYDAASGSFCNFGEGTSMPSIHTAIYKLMQCVEISGWPGTYSNTYPVSHQFGWGWISGSNQAVGSSTQQFDPGGAGFQQALEPAYFFNNVSNTAALFDVQSGYTGTCRAMAQSVTRKTTGTTLQVLSYLSQDQDAAVFCADLIGGSALTIADDKSNTWTALQGGTNTVRLSAWRTRAGASGMTTVTVTSDSSANAIACTMIQLRGVTDATPDKNPAVANDSTSPYDGPSTGVLTQAANIIIGYFALNGPTAYDGSGLGHNSDTVAPGSSDIQASTGPYETGLGIRGTTGGVATTNATIGVVYRVVNATTAVQPQLTNATANRTGVAGTVAYKISSAAALDLQNTDFIQNNREYYKDEGASCSGASCADGVGVGARASRPGNCTTGTAWWATDQGGNWDTSNGSANDGTLDKCTATNTWTNAVYTPKTYPHPNASVTP